MRKKEKEVRSSATGTVKIYSPEELQKFAEARGEVVSKNVKTVDEQRAATAEAYPAGWHAPRRQVPAEVWAQRRQRALEAPDPDWERG